MRPESGPHEILLPGIKLKVEGTGAAEDIDAVVAGLQARGAELVGDVERHEHSCRLG